MMAQQVHIRGNEIGGEQPEGTTLDNCIGEPHEMRTLQS
jgi:hypothetical protein